MIREATAGDLARMEPAAREFYASSGVLRSTGEFDAARFCSLWRELLGSGAGVIFVLEAAGEIVGTIGGAAYPDPYSGALIATEFFWFVRPGWRGNGLGLYRRFEEWARNKGCAAIRMVHLADSMPEKLGRIYRRLGFAPAEIHFMKEL